MSILVAIVGGECTGKSTLARQLCEHLRATTGQPWQRVDEYLREWCQWHGRTPLAHEQLHIAREQTRRIEQARQIGPVVADTTALQTAVYSEWVWQDTSLYAWATQAHAAADCTLLAGIDLPWVVDGHMRDGPSARRSVDNLLRRALSRSGCPFSELTGNVDDRLKSAAISVAAAVAVVPSSAQLSP